MISPRCTIHDRRMDRDHVPRFAADQHRPRFQSIRARATSRLLNSGINLRTKVRGKSHKNELPRVPAGESQINGGSRQATGRMHFETRFLQPPAIPRICRTPVIAPFANTIFSSSRVTFPTTLEKELHAVRATSHRRTSMARCEPTRFGSVSQKYTIKWKR